MSIALIAAALACAAAGAAALEVVAATLSRPTRARRSAIEQARRSPSVASRWTLSRSSDPHAEQLLDAAGRANGVSSVPMLHARERAAALVTATWCGAALLVASGPIAAAAAALAAGAAGRKLPRLLLRRAAAARAQRLREEAPEVVALVAAAAGCGLPLDALFRTAGTWLEGELAAALASAARDLSRGAAPDLVMAALAREHPIDEIVGLVAILQRGRDHGVATAAALKALAASARGARARRAGDRAARAAPRIQLVSALLLVPAALCMLAAAMLSGGLG